MMDEAVMILAAAVFVCAIAGFMFIFAIMLQG